MDKTDQMIVTIDIGTSAVRVILSRVNKFNKIEAIFIEEVKISEVKKGEIVEAYKIAEALKKIFINIKNEYGKEVKSCYVNIPNKYVIIDEVLQEVDINEKMKIVQQYDIDKLFNKIKSSLVSTDRKIIDIIPLQYYDENNNVIESPIYAGTSKLKLRAQVCIASSQYVEQIESILQYSNIKLDGFILQSHAVAKLVLSEEEKKNGVLLLDVGANLTDISVYYDNKLICLDYLELGGENLTSDLAIVLQIDRNEAEKLKRQYPLALKRYIEKDVDILIKQGKGIKIKSSEVVEIIEARCEEILENINNKLQNFDIKKCINTVVIVGQGFNYMSKIDTLIENIIGKKVKIINFKHTNQIKSNFVIAYAMQEYVLYNNTNINSESSQVNEINNSGQAKNFFKIIEKVRNFFYT